jgi:serine/threonine protein kinase
MSKERYEIKGKIGQGGVGSVYRAFDTQLNREVAIKRVLADGGHEDQEEATKNLLKEATALSSIQHPNIVTIYDAGIDDDGPYVVMELINGRTLDEMVEENTLTWEDLREIIIQSEEALAAAQNLNLIHRDLKPSNLMVCWLPSGKFQVKIVDFGLAKFSSSPSLQTIDHGDAVFGSIFFMAPEQFERAPLDQRTDMYALGCLFYYALTGKHPFDGESAAQVMISHLQHHVTPIHELREDIPQWGADWIMWHIERQVDQRPFNAREALERFFAMENEPMTATLPTGPVPTAKLLTNQTTVAKTTTNPVTQAASTVKMAAPTVKMAAPTVKMATPTVEMDGAPPTIKVNKPTEADTQGAQTAKIKAQPMTKPASAVQGGGSIQGDSALGMESAQKTISNGAKWALISMLIAVVILAGVLGRTYMEKRKLDNLYNEVMKEAKTLNDEESDEGISKLALDGILLTEPELIRILNEATSMQENKEKPLILQVLRFAKADGGYDLSTIILNHTLDAKCPSSIRSGLLKDVIGFQANPNNLQALIDYAKKSSEEDSAAAAIYAIRSCHADPKAGDYVKDLLGLVKNSEYPSVRRATETALLSIIQASSKGASYESDIYEAYESAQDENIKLAMLRILGATGDDLAEDAINDALNSGNPSYQNAALTALGKLGSDEKLPILIEFLKNPKNKTMRKDAYKAIDEILNTARERDPDELKNVWQALADTAETDAEKNFIIGGLAMQQYEWSITLLSPFTKDESDRIIDYAERAIRKVEKAIGKSESNANSSK